MSVPSGSVGKEKAEMLDDVVLFSLFVGFILRPSRAAAITGSLL